MSDIRMVLAQQLSRKSPTRGGDAECWRCHAVLTPGMRRRTIHVIAGGTAILHPDDEGLYVSDAGDCGTFEVGIGCARAIGLEWTSRPSIRWSLDGTDYARVSFP